MISGCTIPGGTSDRDASVETMIDLVSKLPGLPESFVYNGYSAGLQNGLNIVSYYIDQDKTKSLMVNVYVSPVPFENPNMEPILALRSEDIMNSAPTIGDSSRLYIQNEMFQLVFIKGKIRAMLVGKGLKQPEVVKIGRSLASALPTEMKIPTTLPKSSKELAIDLYDRYFVSSGLIISDQDAVAVKASACPDNAYITFNFDLKEALPAWKIQLLDGRKNVINEMVKDSAEMKNTSLVIPAIVTSGEYEVLFYIKDTLVFDGTISCGK